MRRTAAAAALALGAAACGGDDDGVDVPASAALVPADAPVYADATVRPEGDRAEAVDAALSKLLNTDDPGELLAEQVDSVLESEDAGITYSEDVEPWLGEDAGLYFTTFGDEPDGAFLVQVTDEAAAQAAVEELRRSQGSRSKERSYQGVEYELDNDDKAVGFVEDFLVVGSESGLRGAVDASGADSLADADAFGSELETLPDDTVAMVTRRASSSTSSRCWSCSRAPAPTTTPTSGPRSRTWTTSTTSSPARPARTMTT